MFIYYCYCTGLAEIFNQYLVLEKDLKFLAGPKSLNLWL
jgi:hypothetical protein